MRYLVVLVHYIFTQRSGVDTLGRLCGRIVSAGTSAADEVAEPHPRFLAMQQSAAPSSDASDSIATEHGDGATAGAHHQSLSTGERTRFSHQAVSSYEAVFT